MGLAKVALVCIQLCLLIEAGQSIRCYGCSGFDISRPLHHITNNPACADGNFDWRQVQIYTAYTPGFSCYSFTYNNGQQEITQRYMIRSPLSRPEDDTKLLPHDRDYMDREYRDRDYREREREYREREREYREREHREREGRERGLGIEGTIVKGFYCHYDYCNGSRAVTSSLGVLLLLSFAVMLFRWWY